MLPSNIFLLGGGASVRYLGGIDKGLFQFLQDKFCIGLNYSYKFGDTTCTLGIDETMYEDEAIHPELAKLPLVIWKSQKHIKHPEPNTIFLKPSKNYDRDLNEGVYRASLSGIFSLSLAIKLMDLVAHTNPSIAGIEKTPEIYILGYDYGPYIKDGKAVLDSNGKPITHFYQDNFTHRGTGKISWYKQTGLDKETQQRKAYADLEFKPFVSEKEVKIYNVGGTSNIPHFEHISYDELFTKKLISVHSQEALRNELREVLTWIKSEKHI